MGVTTTWDTDSVLAASDLWSWVPDEARVHRTGDLLVIAYPDYVGTPTVARSLGSDRNPAGLVEEAHDAARALGRERVWWQVGTGRPPEGLADELLRLGGVVVQRMDVLALPLTDEGTPGLGLPDGVTTRRVEDAASLRQALEVSRAAFDDPPVTDEMVADQLVEVRRTLETASGGRVLASVDGSPASTGGFTMADDVARLWGGGTHPELRGRGAYRAALAARLHLAAGMGATLALTHGRVESSSPILQRLGFTRHGEQQQIVVDL
ncbi:MAG: hypothetical protein JWP82_199 [Humibacillus sp.]|nr:hypothetical protein [Humibacillus sp.]